MEKEDKNREIKTVFITEDDDFLRSLTAKRLEKEGFKVSVAVDGESAINTLTTFKPDVVLLDLLLPGVDGFEVLKKIKSTEGLKQIPVIIFSNLGQKEDIERAKSLGAEDFLVKANFTLDDVVAKINSVVK